MAEQYSIPRISAWALSGFPVVAVVNSAAVNKGVQISRQQPVFISFGYIPRRMRVAASCDSSNLIF